MAGGGSSSSSSTPVDMTPQAFKGLQGPYAAVLGQLLGYKITNPNGTSTNPVSFSYPGGQFSGSGGTGAQTGAGQQARPGQTQYTLGGQSPTSTGEHWMPGAPSTGQSGSGAGGFTVSNPNLGTSNPNDILNGIPNYQGPLMAPVGANEQSTLDQLQNNQNNSQLDPATASFLQQVMGPGYVPGNTTPQSLTAFAQMMQGAQQAPAYDPNQENPFLQSAIKAAQAPTLQGLTETLTRDLPGRFTQAGQFNQPQGSSAFDRAAAIASRGAGDTMGNIAATMSSANSEAQLNRIFQAQQSTQAQENQGLQAKVAQDANATQQAAGRQVQAAGIAPQVSTAQVQNMVSNLQAQALPRLIQEYGIERGMSEFNNRVNSLMGVLGIASGTTQPTISQKSESSSTQKPNILPAL